MPHNDYRLGEYNRKQYFLIVKAEPEYYKPKEFSVSIYYTDRINFENVEIVRIDNSHGYTHIHKNFRREEPTEKVDMDLWDAWSHLDNNWIEYAKKYMNKKTKSD